MSESVQLSVTTSALGFDYDLVIEDWNQKLNGYRTYASGVKEKLEGGTGLSLNLMAQSE